MSARSSLSEDQQVAAIALFEAGWGDSSSPKLIETWARLYRNGGEDALRPKPNGRRRADPAASVAEESELTRLRRENERLKAEVAYLGKLRALRAQERR